MTTDKTPTPPSAEVFEKILQDIDTRAHKVYRRDTIIAHVFTITGGAFAGIGVGLLATGGDVGNLITILLGALIILVSVVIKKGAERRLHAEHARMDAAARLYNLGMIIRDAQATAEARKMREDGE